MPDKITNIEVISDWVCPWCFVGKRRLEAALALRPDLNVTLVWQPFQLSPDMPREGRNRQEYYRDKFGPERAEMMLSGLRQTGEEEGISFGSHADAMAPNTLSAHVLMYWAGTDDRIDANDLAEKLFSAHHVACEDIGDHTTLTRIATQVGMDADEVVARLAAGEDEAIVQERIANAAARGVSGVPFFIINGRYGISGAQPAEVLLSAFEQIEATGSEVVGWEPPRGGSDPTTSDPADRFPYLETIVYASVEIGTVKAKRSRSS